AVTAGPAKVATWSYDIEPTAEGCRVTESWTDQRSSFFAGASKRLTLVKDRSEHNRSTMERTLESLERAATS
ncbi:MAG TPA: polyketide cyclase, partial [Acidimicrobiaceae bacterium]|nr:polyketide cyclase [Acidimicrobiaceae bacterium]